LRSTGKAIKNKIVAIFFSAGAKQQQTADLWMQQTARDEVGLLLGSFFLNKINFFYFSSHLCAKSLLCSVLYKISARDVLFIQISSAAEIISAHLISSHLISSHLCQRRDHLWQR
jgi:hypothetical protein